MIILSFYIQLGAGVGTNIHAELLALWGILHFAKERNLQHFQVARDFLVIIKCFEGLFFVASLVLEPWQRKIRALQEDFIAIQIQHISRILS